MPMGRYEGYQQGERAEASRKENMEVKDRSQKKSRRSNVKATVVRSQLIVDTYRPSVCCCWGVLNRK
jgi:hypothetical protein